MSSLSLFTSTSLPAQATDKAYGVKSADLFRVSSSFDVSSEIPAYAMVGGTILLQQQDADLNKVNLILRPHDQKELKLPIKYVIYRGLKTTDFINNTNLSDTNNKVKTSGNELLVKMQAIQNQRAPGTEIPVEALFGNELSPVSSKNIDEFFFKNLAANSQLFTIDCGIELGKFAVGEIGIEIILENPEYFVTVEIAKKNKYEINVSGITDAAQKKWQKDLVRHFVDPAAFYGLHYDIKGGIEYRQGTDKPVANTSILVYQNIIDKFLTKNKVYLDIRNENGYSYNYYNNYLGTGNDADKNIKIGQSAALLTAKEYYTTGWAVHMVDSTDMISLGNESNFSLALRINDNKKPLIASWNFLPILQSGIVKSDKNVHFVGENDLVTNSSDDYCNVVSFKIPYLPSESKQLATIMKQDYMKQPVSIPTSNDFPRSRFTDYLFGTTNLEMPWDSDDKTQWFTDYYRTYINSSDETGFAGITETGQIIETNSSSSENVIFYAAPISYFSNVGISKLIPLNTKGGVLNIDSIFDLPDVTINKTYLMTSSENILVLSYPEDEKLKKPLFLLGVTKTQWESAINSASSVLSDIHTKLIKLSAASASTDANDTTYYQHEVMLSGLDSTGNYQELNTGISVYTLDHFIFSSKSFAEKYQIDYAEAENNLNDFIDNWKFDKISNYTYEEENMLTINSPTSNGAKNKVLLEKDPTFLTKITDFKTALDGVSTYANLKTLLENRGADLFAHGKARIKISGQQFTNKDGILYIARLRMQVIMKNHPYILSNHPQKIRELYNLFELNSRGLAGSQMPDFSSIGSGIKKILISGFDPFDIGGGSIGKDWQGEISNPSGNIALFVGDQQLKNSSGTVQAIVKSAIFPVRWEDFDKGFPINNLSSKGIAEDFFEKYFTGVNKPDMIITFSYGVHYDKSIDHDFHLERFAGNWQSYADDNNGSENFDRSKRSTHDKSNYIKKLTLQKKDLTFIESTLPFHKLKDPSNNEIIKVSNYHAVVNHGRIPKQQGNFYFQFLNWELYGTPIAGGNEKVITHLLTNHSTPANLFPTPFAQPTNGHIDRTNYRIPVFVGDIDRTKPFLYGGWFACDSNEIKYFYPRTSNPFFIPPLTWENYKDTSLENQFSNIRIEARDASGGTYMSNLIFYRVAYLRKNNNDLIPTGHIHMGFNKDDNNAFDPHGDDPQNRIKMLEDVIEILKKFNDISV